jgi:signal transduction histidine kinase
MGPNPPRPPASLDDLGLRPSRLAAAVVVAAGVPVFVLWLSDGTPGVLAGVGSAAVVVASMLVWLGLRYVRRALAAPIQELGAAMDQLRAHGTAPLLAERGAPFLHPLARIFNQASQTIEQREQLSQANLMSVEVAFDRVHAVLQSLREGVVVVDMNGRVVLANRSARQIVRSDSGPIEGRMLADLVGGPLGEAVREGMERKGAGLEIQRTDLEHESRIFDLTIVQTQSNRPDHDFGKVVVFVDVTRNHELGRLKDDLLSSISHELRTPLTNMCSSSEILATLEPEQEDEWREFVHMLTVESHRLKRIVDDVMLYTGIERGGITWQSEDADVGVLVAEVVDRARASAAAGGLDLQFTTATAAVATVDRRRIAEVVTRLLDNAIKFTPRGGRIHVRVDARDDLVEVAVADSGHGISAEDRQRIFDRFSQVGDVLTSKPKGTGLGLAICRGIVAAMKGTLWCEDSPLGGAQFRFVLPAPCLAAKPA